MKVVLRNRDAPDGSNYCSLTVGHEYEVLGIESDNYRLLNDGGEPIVFDRTCFAVVDPCEPIFWVSEFGEAGERYAYPPGWGVPGFFEDWHDGVRIIRQVFVAQLTHWYPDIEQRSVS